MPAPWHSASTRPLPLSLRKVLHKVLHKVLCVSLCVLAGGLLAPRDAQAQQPEGSRLALPSAASRCEVVQFGGDVGSCQQGACVLAGDAFLVCDDLKVWANEIEVRFTEDRSFAGAEARGQALLIDGRTIVRCEQVTVDADRIRGRVQDATIRFKRGRGTSPAGVPTGRDRWVLEGDFERPDPDHLVVRDGTFTLCDCQGDPPSWRLNATEINVKHEERATLWWPMLYINALGLGLIPVTPPGPPLSIPLQPRALGLLPPRVTFFGPWPMIDLPVFIPLGPSWDITVSAGLRTDWIRNHDFRPSRWGAPRAGARLRYHPTPEVEGELTVDWTWDHRGYVARSYFLANDRTAAITATENLLAGTSDPAQRNQLQRQLNTLTQRQERVDEERDRLAALEHRVLVQMRQRVDPLPELRWLTEVEWLSDDNIRRDFALNLTDQVTNYVASRSQLTYGSQDLPVGLMGLLAVDYLLRTDNGQETYLNTEGAELRVPHRGPALRATLLPWAPFGELEAGALGALLRPLQLDAEVQAARNGPWDPDAPAGLASAGAHLGLAWRDRVGPVAVEGFVEGHGVWGKDEAVGETAVAFLRTGASAHLTWAGSWGEALTHTVTPRLEYVSIPDRRRTRPDLAQAFRRSADEYLDVSVFHQAALSVEQAWWYRDREVATLRLRAPVDLLALEPLPLEAEAGWRLPYVGRGQAWVEVDPRRATEPVLEVGGSLSVPVGPVTLGGSYIRFSPLAEQFQRSIYELAGAALLRHDAIDPTEWVHAVTPSMSLSLYGFFMSYSAVTLLPLPGDAVTDPLRPFVNQHRFSLGYRSPCDCWDISVSGAVPGEGTEQQILDGLRVRVLLSIGGYEVGSR